MGGGEETEIYVGVRYMCVQSLQKLLTVACLAPMWTRPGLREPCVGHPGIAMQPLGYSDCGAPSVPHSRHGTIRDGVQWASGAFASDSCPGYRAVAD